MSGAAVRPRRRALDAAIAMCPVEQPAESNAHAIATGMGLGAAAIGVRRQEGSQVLDVKMAVVGGRHVGVQRFGRCPARTSAEAMR